MTRNGLSAGLNSCPQITRIASGPTAAAAAVTGRVASTSSRSARLKPARMRSCAPAPNNVAIAGASTSPIAEGSRTTPVAIAKAIE